MTDKKEHIPGCEALGGYGQGIGPCSCREAQPEALRLADRLEDFALALPAYGFDDHPPRQSAAELRRQHAEIQQLKAQLSARQAAPDGWRLVPAEPTEEMVAAAEEAHMPFGDMQIAILSALSAAPPPPEREPLSETEVRGLLESAGYWPGEDAQRADFINGLRYGEMAHGIGATVENLQASLGTTK